MQQVTFGADMTKSRRMMYWVALLLLIFGLASGLMLFLGGQPWFLLVEVIGSIAVVIFLLVLVFLLSYFLRKPEVKEKRRLAARSNQNDSQVDAARTDLAAALLKKKTIEEMYEDQKALEKEQFANHTEAVRRRLEENQLAQEQELVQTLAAVQKEHLEAGLRDIAIDPIHVPGIGDLLAEKLQQAGVITAFDVTGEAIQAIPGFGESKALSLIRWRESLENGLRNSQPSQLPAEQVESIQVKYARQKQVLEEELAGAQRSYESVVEKLRQTEANELVSAEAAESTARQNLAGLEAEQQELVGQLGQYQGITFFKFMLAILTGVQENWKTRTGAYLVLLGFFILGFANIVLLITALILSRS